MSEKGDSSREGTLGLVKAREYLTPIGRIPPLFTTAVRSLILDAHSEKQVLRPASQFLSMRLLKSPTMKAMVYYAALTFHHERISNVPYLTSTDLMRLFGPDDLAALFGIIFLYRKAKALGAFPGTEEWEFLAQSLEIRLEIGGHMGYAIPGIGPAKGLLAGAFPLLAQSLVFANDRIGFELYRERLIKNKKAYDLEFENRTWGCTCLDIAANVLQVLGFGVHSVHGILIGLGESPPTSDKDEKIGFQYFMARKWMDTLAVTGAVPDEKLPGQYYPYQKELYKLLYEINQIKEQGSKHHFLKKGKDDVNMKATPQLFQEYLSELQQSDKVMQFMQENLPSELLDSLSSDELKEISGNPDQTSEQSQEIEE